MILLRLIISSAALLTLLPTQILANGATVGNGGDAVVCRDASGAITSAELFDFYEARILREGFTLRPYILAEADQTDSLRMAKAFLRKLSGDPLRAYVYTVTLDELLTKDPFTSVSLRDIQDLGPDLPFEPGCMLEQLAIQMPQFTPQDRQLLINKAIWDALPVVSQAGLYVHEAVYRQALLANGHADSQATRYIVSYLMSDGTYHLHSFSDISNLMRRYNLERLTWVDSGANRTWLILHDYDKDEHYNDLRSTPKEVVEGCRDAGDGFELPDLANVSSLMTRMSERGFGWEGWIAMRSGDKVAATLSLSHLLSGGLTERDSNDNSSRVFNVVACQR